MTYNKTILVTGAAGYIGSHICVELLAEKYQVIAVDNLCNSSVRAIQRVEQISQCALPFYAIDIRDGKTLDELLQKHHIDAVIHCAGLKIMSESVAQPLRYFQNNVAGTATLLETMAQHNIKTVIFSSSAAVYGTPTAVPIAESAPLLANNPYSHSKLMVEQLLADMTLADPAWAIGVLRYFNPVGAHDSGLIGETSHPQSNNLMPSIVRVASGQQSSLPIFGDDYPTADGTGVRDYIHVMDVANAHVAALAHLLQNTNDDARNFTLNLGTGQGHSVLDIVRTFEITCGQSVPYYIESRRSSDTAACYADASQAAALLNWSAKKGLAEMCADHWRWHVQNPNGYL
ncbi:UDP-glucose 4-epimerase GalE [Glaciimonas soli]|uniref:UDP-glucose 4-epimerase n=1 Tax=Glaciimonas soli TaxID=2590999 RepID=A0A843YRK9_9BURK|nr:UDP-glucose 4-epimerase GalE [Glaciimonas soli]MQQ99355.1 UDP-glucose 4-epimerase GalE [Glaciimonas soli]